MAGSRAPEPVLKLMPAGNPAENMDGWENTRKLGLHRVEAATLPHNLRSQRVLERNGFVDFRGCLAYMKIAGQGQGPILNQIVNTDPE